MSSAKGTYMWKLTPKGGVSARLDIEDTPLDFFGCHDGSCKKPKPPACPVAATSVASATHPMAVWMMG